MSAAPEVRFPAKKSLGQHFLRDENILARIAGTAGPLDGEPVIEIGPGPGALTRALLRAGATPLIAIEKDRRFAAALADWPETKDGRLVVIETDALEADEGALLAQYAQGRAARIVANLPYNVATPLFVRWLKAGAWRGPMILMFQKEVARRIAAAPSSAAYGRLSVLAQAVCTVDLAFEVPAGAFSPPPKVDSAVVRLDPLPDCAVDFPALERVTAAAFGQRRKMLRASLSSLGDAHALLAKARIEPTLRAEQVPVSGFLALAAAWRER